MTVVGANTAQVADDQRVAWVRRHVFAFAFVAVAASVVGLFLTVWRPRYRPSTQKVPAARLPYSDVQFTADDAKRAFAAVGVQLVLKSRIPGLVTTIGSRHDAFEDDHHASIRDHSRPNSNVNGISGCVAGGTLQTTARRDRELGFDRELTLQ